MDKYALRTTYDDIDALSKAAFNARDGSKVVKVDLEALKHLVLDHGKLVEILKPQITGHV